jgi:hypothetical protein
MKFNELDKDYQEIAITMIVDRLNMWEEENHSFDTSHIKEVITYKTHKDYVINTANNVIWNIEQDGTLNYELA